MAGKKLLIFKIAGLIITFLIVLVLWGGGLVHFWSTKWGAVYALGTVSCLLLIQRIVHGWFRILITNLKLNGRSENEVKMIYHCKRLIENYAKTELLQSRLLKVSLILFVVMLALTLTK